MRFTIMPREGWTGIDSLKSTKRKRLRQDNYEAVELRRAFLGAFLEASADRPSMKSQQNSITQLNKNKKSSFKESKAPILRLRREDKEMGTKIKAELKAFCPSYYC